MPSNDSMFLLVNHLVSSIKTRDWELLASILDPDVTWSFPGVGQIAGKSAGRDEIIREAQRIVHHGVIFQLHQIFYGMEGMTLLFDEDLVVVCTIRDGRILVLDFFMTDADRIGSYCRVDL